MTKVKLSISMYVFMMDFVTMLILSGTAKSEYQWYSGTNNSGVLQLSQPIEINFDNPKLVGKVYIETGCESEIAIDGNIQLYDGFGENQIIVLVIPFSRLKCGDTINVEQVIKTTKVKLIMTNARYKPYISNVAIIPKVSLTTWKVYADDIPFTTPNPTTPTFTPLPTPIANTPEIQTQSATAPAIPPTSTQTPQPPIPEMFGPINWVLVGGAILAILLVGALVLRMRKLKGNETKAAEKTNPVDVPAEEPDKKSKAVFIEKSKEPDVKQPKETGAVNIKSAYEYKGAKIYFKIKVENNTLEPISDIKVHLFVPDVFLLAEKEKSLSMLEPKESKTVTFEIRPTGECGDCNVSGKVEYYDYSTKGRQMLDIETKSLSVICPVLKRKEIDIKQWEQVTDELIKAEENIKELSVPAENLFNITSRVIKDSGMFMLKPEITSTPQLFNGIAMFYAQGVTGLRYATYIEVVGGARKSRMILKVWAEKEEALTGFCHRILDEIEKRIDVKIFIDDAIVQQHIHIGDKIGTQVKDSFVQRSNIGAGARKCPNCGREVDENEKFCMDCGEKL
jgi:hypothetical protein